MFFVLIWQKDLLGNVIAILDSEGNIVVKYNYDAWGNHTVVGPDGYTQITDVTSIGIINPNYLTCRILIGGKHEAILQIKW